MSQRGVQSWLSRFGLERLALWLTGLSLLALVGVLWLGWRGQLILPMTGDRYLLGLAGFQARASRNVLELILSQIPLALIVVFVMSLALWLVTQPLAKDSAIAWRHWAVCALLWVLGLLVLVLYGAEQPWYPINRLLAFEGGVPFQHRMLFAMPAMVWNSLVPGRPLLEAYLLSQALALAFAIWANYWLACCLVRRDHAIVGPILAFTAWAVTLTYFTFYDLAIIGFFAVSLRLLLKGAVYAYLVVFAIATLNHEISLLLVLVAWAMGWRQLGWRHQALLLAAQLAIYAGVRAALFAVLPMDAAWQGGKPAFNWLLLTQRTQEVAFSLAPVVAFFLVSLWCSQRALIPLRRAVVLWPCLLLMTVTVGQLNEGRQFDAYIPLGAAYCLCWMRFRVDGDRP